MAYLILGLGNPGEKYENTRHNAGQIILDKILGNIDWSESSKSDLLFYKDKIGAKPVEYIKPLTFMNKSGLAVARAKDKHKVPTKNIVVIYDDIDLPIGTMRISFNRGDGGHNGLVSIIKAIKSREFIRIRLGIAPVTPSGKIKKPRGEEAVLKHILGEFKPAERKMLERLAKKIASAIETILNESLEKAMTLYNQ